MLAGPETGYPLQQTRHEISLMGIILLSFLPSADPHL